MMKKSTFILFALITFGCFSTVVHAQNKDEVINGSYFIAFGRYANSGEMSYWKQNVGSKTIPQMVDNHKNYLRSDKNEREATIRRSYQDAFGWAASADEVKYWGGQNKTYAELMTNHINNWLNVYPDKKQQVINQSYYKVFGRAASADEIKYWMSQATSSYVQLVAMHTTWKNKNQPKSTSTAIAPNINSNGVSTATFSAGAAAGIIAAGAGNVIAPGGGNIVAGGAGNVVASGGLN